jgi:glutamyl-Q tRNA(Asp) synthetase
VRMEDIDTPRVEPGADRHILRTLTEFGFRWDGDVLYGDVLYQSTRIPAYEAALEQLRKAGHAYACGCTRREIASDRYPGTCRDGLPPGRSARAWRVPTSGAVISFEDRVQGPQQENVEQHCGDFVVLRADGLFAYQLAVVVDDRDQGVTDVVRGADLLDSTARQIHLQRLLGAPTPRYLHVPVAVDASGEKLSKQTRAPAVDAERAVPLLLDCLDFLGQNPPPDLATIEAIQNWAIANWRVEAIPRTLGKLKQGH